MSIRPSNYFRQIHVREPDGGNILKIKTRKLVFWAAMIFFLFTASLFVFSQLVTQGDERLYQDDFVNILIKAMGLEKELGATASIVDKTSKLRELKLAPPGGWDPAKLLLKGDVAVVLSQILGVEMPSGATPEEYVRELANHSIMMDSGIEEPLSIAELATTINNAAATSAAPPGWGRIPVYRIPVSPVGWEQTKLYNELYGD